MLKTEIVYKGRKPRSSEIQELFELMPSIDIIWHRYLPEDIKISTDPVFGIKAVDWTWFQKLFSKDADIKCLLLEQNDLKGLGVTNHVGFYRIDSDGKHDFYMSSLPYLDYNAGKNGFKSSFAWLFVHEFLHGAVYAETKDSNLAGSLPHKWQADGTLKVELAKYMEKYNRLEQQVSLLTKAVTLLTQLFTLKKKPSMIHPLRLPFRTQITQPYGVENPIYTRTGRHLGTDYACPVGTPLAAPTNGKIIFAGASTQRGNYVQFQHDNYVLELRHLSRFMPVGDYKLGDVIAYSGNTGSLTSGPHICVVVWNGKDGLGIINKLNWSELTTDPDKLYV